MLPFCSGVTFGFAESPNRMRLRVVVSGNPEAVGMNDSDLQIVKERVSDTNALIALGGLGVELLNRSS